MPIYKLLARRFTGMPFSVKDLLKRGALPQPGQDRSLSGSLTDRLTR
jgi:hypothetical protein